MAKKTGGLGRGLDALFADAAPIKEEDYILTAKEPVVEDDAKAEQKATPKKESASKTKAKVNDEDVVLYIDINDIKPNSAQPRTKFDEDKLKELANSIEENGVIQPLVIRPADTGYELVAGERRWRASRLAGLKKVPCLVRNYDEKQNAIVAIIENMQREDLDAIEEAAGLLAMSKKYGFTQEQISVSLGKSRAYIANSLRLLKLPEKIQEYIQNGEISAAHGRTLITVGDEKTQIEICEKIIKDGLSVRATEKLAEKIKDDAKPERKKRKPKETKPQEILDVEAELRTITGTKVTITGDSSTGKIELEYYSLEELNRLIDALRDAF